MNNKKFGLVGENISYSLSPKLHKLLFEFFGIDATYELIDVKKENFDGRIKQIIKDYDGFNVTKPYKNAILPFLDENFSGVVSVNTCTCGDIVQGYNTDIGGFEKSFTAMCPSTIGTVLMLGAGGAAASVACTLKALDTKAYIYNRTYSKAEQLALQYGHKAITINDKISPDIIINCTTLGLGGEQSLPDFVDLSNLKYAYDTIYNPPMTPFLLKAQSNGAKVQNGLGMLIYQAILSEKIWFNLKITPAEKQQAYEFCYKEMKL